jgi:electron transport complex protein RnfE
MLSRHLWTDNPALVQMLGLCPLLAVSNTLVNSVGLAIATLLTVTLSNALVSASRHYLIREIRIPAYVLIIAGLVTVTDLIMQAWFHSLYQRLGIFVPLIITNCAIIARAEIFASRNGVLPSVADGLATGIGFAFALCSLGAIREYLGFGTLLRDAEILFGPAAASWTIEPGLNHDGMLLAVLPPGAFFLLGLMLAMKNLIDQSKTRD